MLGFSLRFAEIQTQSHLIVVGVEVAPDGETRAIAALTAASNSPRRRAEDRRAAAVWILERFNARVMVAKSTGWVTLPKDEDYHAAVMKWADEAPEHSGTIDEALLTTDPVAALAEQACALLRDAARGMRHDDYHRFRWSPGSPIELPSGRPFTLPTPVGRPAFHIDSPAKDFTPAPSERAGLLEARRAFDRKRFPWLSDES